MHGWMEEKTDGQLDGWMLSRICAVLKYCNTGWTDLRIWLRLSHPGFLPHGRPTKTRG